MTLLVNVGTTSAFRCRVKYWTDGKLILLINIMNLQACYNILVYSGQLWLYDNIVCFFS